MAANATIMDQMSAVTAHYSLVVKDNESYRLATLKGGRSSRTGLTIEPTWAEKGSVWAMRTDQVGVKLDRIFRTCGKESLIHFLEHGDLPKTIVLFEGHGTSPSEIREVSWKDFSKVLLEWVSFRILTVPQPPAQNSYESRLARRATRDLRNAYLTAGEAMEGLPARTGSDGATLEVSDTPDEDGDFTWEVLSEGIGRATGFSWSPIVPPTQWRFERAGDHANWTTDDGWNIVSCFSTSGPKGPGWYQVKTRGNWEEGTWESWKGYEHDDWEKDPDSQV